MRAAAADEEREARRAEHVTHPRRAQTAALRGIVGARLEPERQAVGEEDPVAQPTVRRVQGKAVGWIDAHVEAGIARQHIQNVVRPPPPDDQAGPAVAYLGVAPASLRERVGDAAGDFGPPIAVEVEREPSATP